MVQIDNQVPSTDESKAKVPDADPDSDRTPDDFEKNAPKNAAALRNDFDAAVSENVSDPNSNRTPDDSEKVVVAASDNSAFLKKNIPKEKKTSKQLIPKETLILLLLKTTPIRLLLRSTASREGCK